MKQLGLLVGLYVSPVRAMVLLLDEGSPVFGALAVLIVSGLFQFGSIASFDAQAAAAASHQAGFASADSGREISAPAERTGSRAGALTGFVFSGAVGTLIGLGSLYTPALLLAATLLVPIGGFGTAFRRDFAGLLTGVLFIWAAANLPFALASLVVPYATLLRLAGVVAFAVLLTPSVRLSLGTPLFQSAAAVVAGFFGLLLTPFLYLLASPFLLLILAWAFMRGNLSGVAWSLEARRNQRRHLEAATLNPRDAEAHIQLGLIQLRRRQWPEARARFERAVEIEPTDPDAHFQLGCLDRRDGRHPEAEKHFIAVIARDARFSHYEVWREFGANYLDAKAFEDARQALERFVAQRPHDPQGLVLLGESLAALERADEAQTRFREAIAAADSMPFYGRREVAPWRKRAMKQLKG